MGHFIIVTRKSQKKCTCTAMREVSVMKVCSYDTTRQYDTTPRADPGILKGGGLDRGSGGCAPGKIFEH